MTYLLDTNILLRFIDPTDPSHAIVHQAIDHLRLNGHDLRVSTQNCIEFWNVTTRPVTRNGFGRTPKDADQFLRLLTQLFSVLPDDAGVYPEWYRLVSQFDVSGVQVHDARLVAVMRIHQIAHILTFNAADFVRYSPVGITAVEPRSICTTL
ncbi:type II toxin-antitoxin system VapC family toxin [Leptolyngbya sp. FACHB-321]|uniref:type II toxin-antitoxin system VapC family toxin n=1 Tax=Leptolyngbya sp. FACHB-321 TaxID=2692807 RepID=UPI0016838B27|nr:type II toxin-antitoxin system VapC family toxin [Leptolyngbya sp. FACHB-321]MBD2036478.1 type II toxin-antitoxin system VapC family toxin [Leptolyngbya sp. FACHB-321]